MPSKVKKFYFSFLITIFFVVIWVYSPIGDISRSFIKLPDIVPLYSLIFFSLLLILLIVLYEKIERGSWVKVSLYSVVLGYLLSLFALFSAQLFVGAGAERLLNSFHIVGGAAFLITQLLMTGICAGWLYGLLSALAVKTISRFSAR